VSSNPYAAPTTHVADIPEQVADGNFIAEGRTRPAGNGWSWIKSARALTKTRFWLWMGIFIVFAIIAIGLSVIPIIGSLASYLIMPVLFGGVMITCDKARHGREIALGDIFSGFSSHFAKLAGVGLATLLFYIVVLGIIAAIFGTTSALLLSGMETSPDTDPAVLIGLAIAALVMVGLSVPIYMALWFSYSLVAINNYSVLQALKTSFSACLKNIAPFLAYGVMALLLAIGATIPLMLGWLVLGPVLIATIYTSYRDVFYET
jgi:hypothetical protein